MALKALLSVSGRKCHRLIQASCSNVMLELWAISVRPRLGE